MDIDVQFSLTVPVKITRKKKWYLASCPILDVHSQGESERKAKKNLGEALSLFLISCFERGTLDAVLKSCGFKAAYPPSTPLKKRPLVKKEDYINVPIPFLVSQNSQVQCHA